MNDDPIDFSGLDPTRDPAQFEGIVRRIIDAAAPELARRRLRQSVWWQVIAWRRPVFAMGIAAMLLLIGVTQMSDEPGEDESTQDELAIALGVPRGVSDWVTAEVQPTAAQILYPGEEL